MTKIAVGERFGRIIPARHRDPLGFGKTPSRFSDPRRRIPANRFGVVYFGQTLKVCFLEAVLRDNRNGTVGDYPIDERELWQRRFVQVVARRELNVVDLRGDGAVRLGVPSDVAGASAQRLARAWSVAFHDHTASPDGIFYSSRLNGETNLALYDRALSKLAVHAETPLIAAPGLARVLDDLKVALA